MPHLLVLNNYPLENVWAEVQQQEKPDHHLYGINYFYRRRYKVEIVPFKNSPLLQGINSFLSKSRFPVLLGDFDQQWSSLQCLNEADLIYAPCQTQTHLLNYLRAMGLIKIPIVCLAHHPLNVGRLTSIRAPFIRLAVKGTDAFPSLSQGVADLINCTSSGLPKSYSLRWGPDAIFYPSTSVLGQGVVAAGRTGRDFNTFGLAASQTNAQAQIICLKSDVSQTFQTFKQNVQVTIQPNTGYMTYPKLLEIFARARALAIPLLPGVSLSGLTSLMDALGMGKPVIMTKHPLIDLDVEAEGIGKWVKPGDVDGWREAIQFFEDHPDEALGMGQKARKLVEAGLNSESFANQVMDIFDNVLAKNNY